MQALARRVQQIAPDTLRKLTQTRSRPGGHDGLGPFAEWYLCGSEWDLRGSVCRTQVLGSCLSIHHLSRSLLPRLVLRASSHSASALAPNSVHPTNSPEARHSALIRVCLTRRRLGKVELRRTSGSKQCPRFEKSWSGSVCITVPNPAGSQAIPSRLISRLPHSSFNSSFRRTRS